MEKLVPKIDGATPDIVDQNIEKLRELFPAAFTEGSDEHGPRWKVDFDTLREILGSYIEDQAERYSFNWNGKASARRIAQTPSTGTLRPCPEESVNWDTTKNLFIEGDNLEVLKLLQKSYHKKVKMIYIDPPYNTGKEFIYPDKFQDNLDTYLRYTGQVDDEGFKVSINAETSGRYHTNWLNMMLPRLKLARNILTDSGVILVSIGDSELGNLIALMNEVYGEENRVAIFSWKSRAKPTNAGDAKYRPQKVAEYVVVYGRQPGDEMLFNAVPAKTRVYPHKDQDGRYRTTTILTSNRGTFRRETMRFEAGGYSPDEDSRWKAGKSIIDGLFDRNRIKFNEDGIPVEKKYEHEEQDPLYPIYCFMDSDLTGTAETGKADLNELVGNRHGLDTVKPVLLLKYLVTTFSNPADFILDFFAGSCTTAQAVMELNYESFSGRKFMMVQLPELIDKNSEAFKTGFHNVADIGKERIRRVIKKLEKERTDKAKEAQGSLLKDSEQTEEPDLGFKLFKLDASNIKPWDADFDHLEAALFDSVENIKPDRNEADVLYELLLKYGLDLAVPIEQREIAEKTVYIIGAGALIVCLAKNITLDVVEGIAALKEELTPEVMRVVFKDSGFANDVVKTNAVQILRQAGIEDVKSL
jgi:adenine-specific DNA-methyltransferase